MTSEESPAKSNCINPPQLGIILLAVLLLFLLPLFITTLDDISIIVYASAGAIGLFIGVVGFLKFSRYGLFKNDHFHMMGVLLSLGILIMALADIANVLDLILLENVLSYMVTSARATALVIWVLGIIGYARASNNILHFAFPRLWTLSLLLMAFAVIFGLPILPEIITELNALQIVWNFLFSITMGLLTASIFMQFYSLRDGGLGYNLKIAFLGILLMYIQTLIVWYAALSLYVVILMGVMVIESYILLGAYLVCSQSLSLSSLER